MATKPKPAPKPDPITARVLAHIRIPPLAVSIKTADTSGTRHGDSITELHAQTKFELVEKLRHLAEVIACTTGELEGGEIIVLRRRRQIAQGK